MNGVTMLPTLRRKAKTCDKDRNRPIRDSRLTYYPQPSPVLCYPGANHRTEKKAKCSTWNIVQFRADLPFSGRPYATCFFGVGCGPCAASCWARNRVCTTKA